MHVDCWADNCPEWNVEPCSKVCADKNGPGTQNMKRTCGKEYKSFDRYRNRVYTSSWHTDNQKDKR